MSKLTKEEYAFKTLKYLLYFNNRLETKIRFDALNQSSLSTLTHSMLRDIVPHISEVFKLCITDKYTNKSVEEFLVHIALDEYYQNRIPIRTLSKLIDVNNQNHVVNVLCTMYAHYADYLFSVQKVEEASIIVRDQLEQYGAVLSYALEFIDRYCKTYSNLKQNAYELKQLFGKCHNKELYLDLIARDVNAYAYIGETESLISIDSIKRMSPKIAKSMFLDLIDSCVNTHSCNGGDDDTSEIGKVIGLVSTLCRQTTVADFKYPNSANDLSIRKIVNILDTIEELRANNTLISINKLAFADDE